jgi:hypothetical protein
MELQMTGRAHSQSVFTCIVVVGKQQIYDMTREDATDIKDHGEVRWERKLLIAFSKTEDGIKTNCKRVLEGCCKISRSGQ